MSQKEQYTEQLSRVKLMSEGDSTWDLQKSNMSKLMPDGSVRRREDGKILKGPSFFPPNIKSILDSIMENGC